MLLGVSRLIPTFSDFWRANDDAKDRDAGVRRLRDRGFCGADAEGLTPEEGKEEK